MKLRTVRDIDVKGKTVLVRVDYNVPVENGEVGDTMRIEASFETIHYLLGQNCKIVLISHLGRPEGRDAKFSLRPVAAKASELLGKPIGFISDCVGAEVQQRVKALKPGEIILLENLRFYAEEEANDAKFAKQLAGLAEVFVDDAFAAIHREHASTFGVTKLLPSAAGFLVEREVATVEEMLENPARPLVAVIGGAKISTKIEVLENLLPKVDVLVIGGAMANTFLTVEGHSIGKSLNEPDFEKEAKRIMNEAKKLKKKLILPFDAVVTDKVDRDAPAKAVNLREVRANDIIVDMGKSSTELICNEVATAGTVFWNGPLGVTEIPQFSQASKTLANCLAAAPAKSIIGGGDTADFVNELGLARKYSFVSTGGGATLELIAGKKLPALEALSGQNKE